MNDSERFQYFLDYTQKNPNELYALLSFKRAQGLYDILKGKTGISKKTAERICDLYPEVNKIWLLTGEGEMLRNDNKDPQLNNVEPLKNDEVISRLFDQLSTKDGQIKDLLNLVKSQQETISILSKKSEDAEDARGVVKKAALG